MGVRCLAVILAVVLIGTPFLAIAEAAATCEAKVEATAKAKNTQLRKALRHTMLKATQTRELTYRQFWRASRMLKRNAEAAVAVEQFVTEGMIESGVVQSAADIENANWDDDRVKGRFLDWFWENREEILSFILLLIELFSSDTSPMWSSEVAVAEPAGDCLQPGRAPPMFVVAA